MEALDLNKFDITDNDKFYLDRISEKKARLEKANNEVISSVSIRDSLDAISARRKEIAFYGDYTERTIACLFAHIDAARELIDHVIDFKNDSRINASWELDKENISNPFSPDYIKDDAERDKKLSELSDFYLSRMNLPF